MGVFSCKNDFSDDQNLRRRLEHGLSLSPGALALRAELCAHRGQRLLHAGELRARVSPVRLGPGLGQGPTVVNRRTVTTTTTQKVQQPSWAKKQQQGGGGGAGATYTTAGTRVEKFETPAMAGLRIDPRSGKTWKSGGGRVHHNAAKIGEWRGLKGTHALEKDVAVTHGEATKQDRPQENFRAAARKQGYWRG